MSEPAGDGSRVDARRDQLGSGEMSQIVKPKRSKADPVSNSDEESCDVVRTKRP